MLCVPPRVVCYSASIVSGATYRTLTNHIAEQKLKKSTRLISQSALGQKQIETNKRMSNGKNRNNGFLNLSFDWTSRLSLIRFFFLFCNAIG
jgi:hypothetical protein